MCNIDSVDNEEDRRTDRHVDSAKKKTEETKNTEFHDSICTKDGTLIVIISRHLMKTFMLEKC